jgi:hypothetical protein
LKTDPASTAPRLRIFPGSEGFTPLDEPARFVGFYELKPELEVTERQARVIRSIVETIGGVEAILRLTGTLAR